MSKLTVDEFVANDAIAMKEAEDGKKGFDINIKANLVYWNNDLSADAAFGYISGCVKCGLNDYEAVYELTPVLFDEIIPIFEKDFEGVEVEFKFDTENFEGIGFWAEGLNDIDIIGKRK